jgi:hypothetical protein
VLTLGQLPSPRAFCGSRRLPTAYPSPWVSYRGPSLEVDSGCRHVAPRGSIRRQGFTLSVIRGFRCDRSRGSPTAIQSRLEHASITTTLNTYEHLFTQLDKEFAGRLDNIGRTAAVAASLPPLDANRRWNCGSLAARKWSGTRLFPVDPRGLEPLTSWLPANPACTQCVTCENAQAPRTNPT